MQREDDTPIEIPAARPTDPAPPAPVNETETLLAILARLETIDRNVELLVQDARAQRLDFGKRIARLEDLVEATT